MDPDPPVVGTRGRSKHTRIQTAGLFAALLLGGGQPGQASPEATADCIRTAGGVPGIIACERRAQRAARRRIESNLGLLRSQLPEAARQLLEQTHERWQAYLALELRMLDASRAPGADSLAGALRAGAHTQLLEQRAALLEHQLVNRKRSDSGAKK